MKLVLFLEPYLEIESHTSQKVVIVLALNPELLYGDSPLYGA